ncbi:AraC family transcriptional regulator [Caulobacter mirabilis]|uniref:HTH araC/xylS-type domain-containing protein n=1 Tax=Caulobacter mirabilis TaxID=69666 RepID=A0A2D2B1C6_9CAUL|nr:helix-turn-helix domain-containing protein [Caulobacter mirabilis]ATQ44065.1 hypothetical protein CSW64_17550 [Caulobacter mirabilis]
MSAAMLLSGFSLVAACICLILAGFLLAARSRIALSNRMLAGFLILTAADLSGWFIDANDLLPIKASVFRFSLAYLQMPFFLGYFAAVCRADFALRMSWLWHALPFLAATLLLTPRIYTGQLDAGAVIGSPEFQVARAGLAVQYYAYIAAIVVLLLRVRSAFADRYVGVSSKALNWLTQLLVSSLLAQPLGVAKRLALAGPAQAVADWAQLAVATYALGVMIWITFKALLEPDLFRVADSRLRQASGGADGETDARLSRLNAVMERDQPHLDPGLNLEGLAARLALTPRELSELINREFGVRFFDFVNRYRVDVAAGLLAEGGRKGMLQVLHEAGFSSKSSFNAAFLKHRGMTPSAFRAQQRREA